MENATLMIMVLHRMDSQRGMNVRGIRKAGFTLVEAMVAGSVLLIFVAGFTTALIFGVRSLQTANNHYRAMSIARNRLQRAMSFDFNSLDLLRESDVRIDHFGNLDGQGRFRRSTRVSTNWPTPYTVRVQVGVRYPLARGPELSPPIVIDTLFAVQR